MTSFPQFGSRSTPVAFTLPDLSLRGRGVRSGFTLVELLTVIFIISLLIGILVPTIRGARNAAKKATTAKTIDTVKVALEMFKNDNEAEFRQTNGYPPSFAHPPIPGYTFQPHLGEFPFIKQTPPVVYGAHWLPAMLMGRDFNGYIVRSSIPKENNLQQEPWKWYEANPLGTGKALPRQELYLDPSKTRTVANDRLQGRQPTDFFPNWDDMKTLPLIVDAFDQPILYYVASAHGRPTNMLADARDQANNYSGGVQQEGVPYYFHQDNEGFTGTKDSPTGTLKPGWDLAGTSGEHAIAFSGAALKPADLVDPANRNSFARYIVDRKIYSAMATALAAATPPPDTTQLRPVNAESFLLISAGPDGRYGTNDDVSNLPPFEEE